MTLNCCNLPRFAQRDCSHSESHESQSETRPIYTNSGVDSGDLQPLPRDPLGQRFCQIFNYGWNWIERGPEPESPWRTINRYPIKPRILWQSWGDDRSIIGLRFGSETSYALLDVDAGSAYHPQHDPAALDSIRGILEDIGITRSLLLSSSDSGGLHLYLPLPESVPTFGLACALKQVLESGGFKIRQGQLEIFPNVKTYGESGKFTDYNGHRLPLQPGTGSYLLDDDLQPTTSTLGDFFRQWDWAIAGQDLEELTRAIANSRTFKKDYSSGAILWRKNLEQLISEGWTGLGQTNKLLKEIATYGVVFLGLEKTDLEEYICRTAIAAPGYNEFCRHRHEIARRAREWRKSVEQHYWAYGTPAKRRAKAGADKPSGNATRSQEALARIKAAVATLEEQGLLPGLPGARSEAIVAIADCSKATLYKHLELWHPEHYLPESCVKPCPETVSAIQDPAIAPKENACNPCYEGLVHTLAPMKCLEPEAAFQNSKKSHLARDFSTDSIPKYDRGPSTKKTIPDLVPVNSMSGKAFTGSSRRGWASAEEIRQIEESLKSRSCS